MARPLGEVVNGSVRYARQSGIHLPDIDYSQTAITRRASRALGHAYDVLPDFQAEAVPAYKAFREETMRQFDHMTKPASKGGMGIDVHPVADDPYGKNSVHDIVNEVRDDVQNRGHIKVMSTATTGGHPFLSNDENDAFRGVHDVFGHLGSGRGIDMHGEEAAFQKHSRMYSPLARQAMATETRGQNGALQLHGQFQDQKVALLPQHMQGLQFGRVGTPQERAASSLDARREDRKQGL